MEAFKDRLAHILRSKNLTGTQFAGLMGIQPSNVSHLLSGRNNPSLDFLIKLKEAFPEYSFDWIILGRKPITMAGTLNDNEQIAERMQTENKQSKQLDFDIIDNDDDSEIFEETSPIDEKPVDSALPNDNHTDIMEKHEFHRHDDKPKKVLIMYDDNTFEMFNMRR